MTSQRLLSCCGACLMFWAVINGDRAAANDPPPGWSLVWEDEFNAFDSAKWTKINTNSTTNNSIQDYLPEQVTVENGMLVITAEDRPSRGLPFRAGQVISKSEQTHGRWEVRAKLPGTRGTWPAIWLLPDTSQYNWPSGGEIDIMENRGNQPKLTSSAFHYGTNPPYSHHFVYDEQQTSLGGSLVNYHDSFHTYAVDWTADSLRFYLDDVNYYTVYDADVGGFLSQNVKPMQLVINTAIGGDFLPNPDSSSVWPQRFEVDWVRVYEPSAEPAMHGFDNGGFEASGGTLAGWSVFGERLQDNPNVQVSAEAVNEGNASLKLFGDFSPGASYSGVHQGVTVSPGAVVTASLDSFIKSADSIAGTDNSVVLKIEYYSQFGAKFGSAAMLGVEEQVFATGASPEDQWTHHELPSVAPAGAVEARLAIVFIQPGQSPGAVHVDGVKLLAAAPAAAVGDYNADGVTDAADYVVWRDTLGEAGAQLPADGDGDGR
ncbi:MAG: glycoside hydrolase family 16 protein, partial [Planctomycetales bacterium]|nr:glycoside hydrolase family 16 protein [Planctomycetales bacterium]